MYYFFAYITIKMSKKTLKKSLKELKEDCIRLGFSSHRTKSTLHERIDESNRQIMNQRDT